MSKILIKEDTYSEGFGKIRKGDIINIVTDKNNIEAEVVDVYSTQIIFNALSKYYLISSSSMIDDVLDFIEDPKDKKIKGKIKNIKSIIITRNGNSVSKIYPKKINNNTNNKTNKSNPVIKPFYKEAYDSILSDLNDILEGDTLFFNFGELLTKSDIKNESKSFIAIEVQKIFKGNILKCLITEVRGDLVKNLTHLKDKIVALNKTNSFILSEKGVTLNLKLYKENKTSDLISINGLYQIENKGQGTSGYDFKDLMQNKNFRNLMLSKPNFWGSFLNKNPKGVLPLMNALNQGVSNDSLFSVAKNYMGKNEYFSKGKKVKITYLSPKEINLNELILRNGNNYAGVFVDSKKLKLTISKHNVRILMELLEKIDDNKYRVKITKENTKDILNEPIDYGQGIIQIQNND